MEPPARPGGGVRSLYALGVGLAVLGFLMFVGSVVGGGYCASGVNSGCFSVVRFSNSFLALELFGGLMFALGIVLIIVGVLKKV